MPFTSDPVEYLVSVISCWTLNADDIKMNRLEACPWQVYTIVGEKQFYIEESHLHEEIIVHVTIRGRKTKSSEKKVLQ